MNRIPVIENVTCSFVATEPNKPSCFKWLGEDDVYQYEWAYSPGTKVGDTGKLVFRPVRDYGFYIFHPEN